MILRRVAVNDRGRVVGEDHWRAKLTDHEVELIKQLLTERAALVESLRGDHVGCGSVNRCLHARRLSYAAIANMFEASKSYVRDVDTGRVRSQTSYRTTLRRVKPAKPKQEHQGATPSNR